METAYMGLINVEPVSRGHLYGIVLCALECVWEGHRHPCARNAETLIISLFQKHTNCTTSDDKSGCCSRATGSHCSDELMEGGLAPPVKSAPFLYMKVLPDNTITVVIVSHKDWCLGSHRAVALPL